ncbi:MAG: molybdopterin-dependent oxidoreductase, partial [Treponema sp.]|nr:molybdopterin-dependent oxidoreductase [Treponema sp.]
ALAVPSLPPQAAPPGSAETAKPAKNDCSFTIYTATQWPYQVKRSAALVLGLNGELVKIIPTVMAVHLDGKLWYPSLVACHAALAAWVTKSPVKLMLTREEDFMYSPKRNKSEIEINSALGEKGEILGSIVRVTLDLGAHGIFEDEIIDHTSLGALGLYNHHAYRLSAAGIRTNIPPQGPMAGFGLSQGFFAIERHVSRIADSLGQDPAEWRKNNFLKKNENLAIGTALKDPVPLPELVDAAAAMSDYYRKWSSYELLRTSRRGKKWDFRSDPLRGIGISVACQGNGFLYNNETGNGNCAVELTLEKDGSLIIKTSLVTSENTYTDTWRNLAQEILGLEPALIRLINNTGEAPDSGPGTLSRNISSVTKLVERCCTVIRKQRFRSPLPITVKRSAKPGKVPGWIPEKDIDGETFAHPSWGAAIAEVEIDPVSLSPRVRGIWLAVDGGKILSQRRARRTLTTGIIQALGWTCREHVRYEEGRIPQELYRGYDIPSPAEIPPINVDFIWNDDAAPKGIGELPFCCVPAAYAQAVSQAMDYSFEKIPLDARDIFEAGKLKQTEFQL